MFCVTDDESWEDRDGEDSENSQMRINITKEFAFTISSLTVLN